MTTYSNKMTRYIKLVASGVLLVTILFFILKKDVSKNSVIPQNSDQQVATISSSPLDATYLIEGKEIKLTNGKIEKNIPLGATSNMKITVSVFGQPTYTDLNGDGAKDAVLFLYEELGGSGTFFYVVVAVNESGKYIGLNALLLGDRIAPQTIDAMNGKVAVNYAVRKDTEPMSAQPSIGVTKYVKIEEGKLVEVN